MTQKVTIVMRIYIIAGNAVVTSWYLQSAINAITRTAGHMDVTIEVVIAWNITIIMKKRKLREILRCLIKSRM